MKQENPVLQQVLAVGLPEREYLYLKENLKGSQLEVMAQDAVETLRFSGSDSLVISGDSKVLKWAEEQDIATIGYQLRRAVEAEYLHADIIAEGFEEIDAEFLIRVFERHHNLPWTILTTERCIVRELALSDMDALFELYEDGSMTEYMEGLYSYEEETAYQKAYIENMYRFYGYGMWLVFEKATGKLIGRAGLEHREELGGEMELGYAIGGGYRKRGYATEVCEAIMDYAAEYLGVTALNCLIEPENSVSVHLAEKLGFSYDGIVEVGGKQMKKYHRRMESR